MKSGHLWFCDSDRFNFRLLLKVLSLLDTGGTSIC
jgi:hypothetical protein